MKIANNKPPIVDDACAVHEKKTILGRIKFTTLRHCTSNILKLS